MENVQLSDIMRIETPAGDNIRQSRLFIFDTYAVIFEAKNGKAFASHVFPYTSWARSKAPRTHPHTITDTSGGVWSCYRGGCGCGSPIKKVTPRDAWNAVDSHMTPATSDSS